MVGILIVIGIIVVWYAAEAILDRVIDGGFNLTGRIWDSIRGAGRAKPDSEGAPSSGFVPDVDDDS